MASEKLCVRWNDFESNFSVAFRDLREAKELFNVTLACDEDQIQAHKVILLARVNIDPKHFLFPRSKLFLSKCFKYTFSQIFSLASI